MYKTRGPKPASANLPDRVNGLSGPAHEEGESRGVCLTPNLVARDRRSCNGSGGKSTIEATGRFKKSKYGKEGSEGGLAG